MWLAQTPTAVVLSSFARIPRLEAEQSMLTVNRISMGSGTMEEHAAKALSDQWRRATSGDVVDSAAAAPKRRPDPEHLRARGFGVRRVQKPRTA